MGLRRLLGRGNDPAKHASAPEPAPFVPREREVEPERSLDDIANELNGWEKLHSRGKQLEQLAAAWREAVPKIRAERARLRAELAFHLGGEEADVKVAVEKLVEMNDERDPDGSQRAEIRQRLERTDEGDVRRDGTPS
jgi:hypothetical protein